MNPEMHLAGMFSGEESELNNLKARLAEMERERQALGEIDSVQLTDLDIERMAELDETIIEFKQRLADLEPKVESDKNQEAGIQELGDSVH